MMQGAHDGLSITATTINALLQNLVIPNLWQQDAVRTLREGRDVVVHAPTGAGKTYIFELFLPALKGQAIFTVPTRALANDKLAEWQAHGWDVGISTGDVAHKLDAKIVVAWLRRIGRDVVLVSHTERPVPLEEVDLDNLPNKTPANVRGRWPRLVGNALRADLGPILLFAPRRNASEELVFDLANLRAGPRFAGDDSPYGGRLGAHSQRVYERADVPGYLDMGVPLDYGAGASEVVREIVGRGASRSRLLTESLRQGDIERALIEWRSLLRHIIWAPDYDLPRWHALQSAANDLLEKSTSPAAMALP